MYFYTNTAVADVDGKTKFFSSGDFKHLESGGGIISPTISKNSQEAEMLLAKLNNNTRQNNKASENQKAVDHNPVLVKVVRLSDFINKVVATRRIPEASPLFSRYSVTQRSPNVVKKLDIEGSEVDVVPDLFFAGSLQHLDAMMIEWHQFLFLNSTTAGTFSREMADKVILAIYYLILHIIM